MRIPRDLEENSVRELLLSHAEGTAQPLFQFQAISLITGKRDSSFYGLDAGPAAHKVCEARQRGFDVELVTVVECDPGADAEDSHPAPRPSSIARRSSCLARGATLTGGENPDSEPPDEQEARLRDLARLSLLEYDQCRKEAAKELEVRVTTLDSEVADRRPKNGSADGRGGDPVLFEPIEPWPEPVNGDALLADLVAAVQRFVVLDEHAAVAIALWVLHAHAHDAAWISPVLALLSPEKRCGKTTLLALLQKLVPRPLTAANITSAALFRATEKWKPTLLVDEADSFLKDNEELRGVLNSGHHRAAAQVIRTAGEDHEPRAFRTWAPKAIALIGALPGTLEDRSIVISMRRKRAGQKVGSLRADRDYGLGDLARRCARWVSDHTSALADSDPDLPRSLNDRAADNWRPLAAIAEQIGGPWPARVREAAIALCPGTEDETSLGVLVLSDIQGVFNGRDCERISSKDMAEALARLDDRPWADWRGGNGFTTNALARLLKPFGLRPKQMRIGAVTIKGYDRDWFVDAFSRYLPSTPDSTETSNQVNENKDLEADPTETRSADVSVPESENPNENGKCLDVSVAESGDRGSGGIERGRLLPLPEVDGLRMWVVDEPSGTRRWELRRANSEVAGRTEPDDFSEMDRWKVALEKGRSPLAPDGEASESPRSDGSDG